MTAEHGKRWTYQMGCRCGDCVEANRAYGRQYQRIRKTPLRPPRSLWDRTFDKIDASGDCWVWTASLTEAGYGQIHKNGRPQLAHRVVWELLVGPIPSGMQIDHLCRLRRCVNPDHLEPVTQAENIHRGAARAILSSHSGRCKRGHPLAAMPSTWSALNRKHWCPTCSRWYAAARTFAKWAAA